MILESGSPFLDPDEISNGQSTTGVQREKSCGKAETGLHIPREMEASVYKWMVDHTIDMHQDTIGVRNHYVGTYLDGGQLYGLRLQVDHTSEKIRWLSIRRLFSDTGVDYLWYMREGGGGRLASYYGCEMKSEINPTLAIYKNVCEYNVHREGLLRNTPFSMYPHNPPNVAVNNRLCKVMKLEMSCGAAPPQAPTIEVDEVLSFMCELPRERMVIRLDHRGMRLSF